MGFFLLDRNSGRATRTAPLAAAVTARMTPACWPGVRGAHGVLKIARPGEVGRLNHREIVLDEGLRVSVLIVHPHLRGMAGLSVLGFCGVAGTSTWVVTPSGEMPTARAAPVRRAGAAARGHRRFRGRQEGFFSFDGTASDRECQGAPHIAARWRYRRMPPNLCNTSAPSGPAPTDQSINRCHRNHRRCRLRSPIRY